MAESSIAMLQKDLEIARLNRAEKLTAVQASHLGRDWTIKQAEFEDADKKVNAIEERLLASKSGARFMGDSAVTMAELEFLCGGVSMLPISDIEGGISGLRETTVAQNALAAGFFREGFIDTLEGGLDAMDRSISIPRNCWSDSPGRGIASVANGAGGSVDSTSPYSNKALDGDGLSNSSSPLLRKDSPTAILRKKVMYDRVIDSIDVFYVIRGRVERAYKSYIEGVDCFDHYEKTYLNYRESYSSCRNYYTEYLNAIEDCGKDGTMEDIDRKNKDAVFKVLNEMHEDANSAYQVYVSQLNKK